MLAIELENAVKTYKIGEVETRALDGVSLGIQEGEFTALVGPSGSGKTTMLQLMGCLDRPNSGVVRIGGQDVTSLKANPRADLRREKIGFIFQFFALVPVLTAYENVELPLLLNLAGWKPNFLVNSLSPTYTWFLTVGDGALTMGSVAPEIKCRCFCKSSAASLTA